MKKETKKAPTIRFRGFTDDWEQRKLGECCQEFKSGSFIPASDIGDVGKYPVYGGNGLRGFSSEYNHDGEFALIGRQGALCGNMNYSVGRAYFTEHAIVVQANKTADTKFLYYLLKKMNLGQYSDQSAQPGLAVGKLVKLIALVPSVAEQIKIGYQFMGIDHLITLHQRKLDQLKKLKKYFLQNMFPTKGEKVPRIRFKGFTGDWKQRKFGEIAEYKKGPFGSALKKDFFIPDSATSVKVYEQQNAINKNWNLSRYYISKEYAQKLKSFEVHAGDIIVSCAGTIGEIYELPAQSRSGIINQALMRIRVDEETVCKDIFKLAFSNMIDSFSREFSNGSAIKNIPPFADLKPMKVLLPNKDEQKIIGDFFTDIDKTITLHQRKLNQLQTMKKFMLQNLFI